VSSWLAFRRPSSTWRSDLCSCGTGTFVSVCARFLLLDDLSRCEVRVSYLCMLFPADLINDLIIYDALVLSWILLVYMYMLDHNGNSQP
jgi:hypothetical protein